MKKFMRIWVAALVMMCTCFWGLTACESKGDNEKTDEVAKTSVSLNKDGSISSRIVEDFEESYYDADELKSMIETSIDEYRKENSSAEVTLKDCRAEGSTINVDLEYGDYISYAGFNKESFFAGNIQAANMAGFNLNVSLNAVSDKAEKQVISKPDILGMGENHVVIVEAPPVNDDGEADTIRVNCFGDILYVGDGVEVVNKKSADVKLAGGYGIIVFK